MKNIKLFIPIVPIPKARPRVRKDGQAYTPKATKDYEKKLKVVFLEAWGADTPPMNGPIMAEVWFFMPRPKSVSKKKKYPDTKPDIDNLEKAVFDALDFSFSDTNRKINKKNKEIILLNKKRPADDQLPLLPKIENGRVIDNDSRIVSKISHKRFSDSAGKDSPGIEIILREIDTENIVNTNVITPIAAIFTGENNERYYKKVAAALLQKSYCPIFLDAVETPKNVSKYTSEILKITELLCIIENSNGKHLNPNLDKTMVIADKLGKETFKITL